MSALETTNNSNKKATIVPKAKAKRIFDMSKISGSDQNVVDWYNCNQKPCWV